MAKVVILATLETKAAQAAYLEERLAALGVTAQMLDASLHAGGRVYEGAEKRAAIDGAAEGSQAALALAVGEGAQVVIALGGGTGGEIALKALRALPITFPKLLVTTLPFDPRAAVADNAITLVPTLADMAGLNDVLREALDAAALMASGLSRKSDLSAVVPVASRVAITALGATEGAVAPLVAALEGRGREATVFHANGFGGAAYSRFAEQGAFDSVIDLTPHELTRLYLTGAHVPMPGRFSAAGGAVRVVLPGAMNFIGLGALDTLPDAYRSRPHYAHSGFFTHVKVTSEEMRLLAARLAAHLNALEGPSAVLVPMGGFSHQDRPGGAIEDPSLRAVCLETLRGALTSQTSVQALDGHISDRSVTDAILTTLDDLSERADLCMT